LVDNFVAILIKVLKNDIYFFIFCVEELFEIFFG